MKSTRTTRWLSIVFSVAVLASCAFAQSPKYIILFIGDGMGPNQRILSEKVSEATSRGKLDMNHLPVQGESMTNSLGGVTDSAAAATALSCGVKTNNGMLGMTPDQTHVNSVTVDAKKAGWKVGVISNATTNHATPAGFYAHVTSRDMYDAILLQAADSGIDFFGGPGFSTEHGEEHARKTLSDGGYEVVKGAFDPANPPKLPCANTGISSLADATRAALTLLENPTGFFIMVEGAAIDWCGHGNDFPGTVRETIDMNDAVRVALDFYKQHPDETLIVVTADHETGGLTIANKDLDPKGLLNVKSPGDVEGYLNSIWKETMDDKEFIQKITEAIHLKAISDADQKTILELRSKDDLGGCKNEIIRLMNAQAGITWTTGGHTSTNVPTTAIGVGSEAFKGEYENTHIAETIRGYINATAEKKAAE